MSSIWERFCRKLFRPASRRNPPQAPRFAKLGLEILEDRTLPSTFVFTNAAGGGGWNTPGNWAVGGAGTLALPGPTDDAAIGAIGGVTFAVVLDGSNATVNSVGLGVGCSLTVGSALEANSIATDPGTVFDVTTGTQPAEVKIDQTATFSGSVIDAGRIIANTTNPFMGTGVTFGGGALIGPGDLNGNLVAGPNSSITFTNTGEFAPGATFGIGSGSIVVAAGVTVDGNLDVNNESLSVVPGGTLGGAGSVTINSNLNWTGGAITVAGGVTALAGPVTTSGGGVKTLGATLTNENPLTNLGGAGGLALTATGAIDNIGNATINLSLPFITTSMGAIGITNTAGSTLDVTAPSSAPTVITVPFANSGFLKVESGDALVLSTTGPGTPTDTLDGVLQLLGTLTLEGAFTSVTGFMLQADPGFLEVGSPTGGSTAVLTVPSGVIDTLDGNLAVNSGSMLTGAGQITNAGRLELEMGSTTMGLGSYVQTSIGTLALAEMGPGFSSSLTVAGPAQLSGTLVLMGPPPPVGTIYTVVMAGRVSGHFDTIPDGMSETDTSTSITVTQVRPPA